jgi:hypothetical protein
MDRELMSVRAWAQGKLDANQEPPWAVQRYQDLVALLDEILASRASTVTLEDSLRSQAQSESVLQRGENIVHIDSAQRRLTVRKVQLPM